MPDMNFQIHKSKLGVSKMVIVENAMAGTRKSAFL